MAEQIYNYRVKEGLEKDYESYAKKNRDDYGSAVVRFAMRWAMAMEKAMGEGQELGEVAKALSHEADTEGITGYMYGCAVSELAEFWVHGEQLRQWHNLDTQVRAEGEAANESGGVLNPALLTMAVVEADKPA